MSMQYAMRQIDDVTVLDLSGRITLGEVLAIGPRSVMVLHELVRDLVRRGSRKMLLNLQNVTYIDSAGLGELVTCMTTVRNQGGQFRLCGANKQVQDMLNITRLAAVLDLRLDEPAALKSLTADRQKGTSAA